MKPIKLKMTAFEPFAKTVELDFEKGLAGENFFLIHGATGAGKTSILDAMCYALYGNSSGGDRTGKMMRSEQAPSNVQTEVDFTFALGEKIYRIKRGFKLGANSTAEIYCNSLPLETGADKVTAKVHEIIGFKIDQFRQVILLPQGNFKKFLTANARARGEVLNTLFDANFYAVVENRLKEKAAAAGKICTDLDAQKFNLEEDARQFADIQDEKINLPALLETFTENLRRAKSKVSELKLQLDKANANLTAAEILNKDFANLRDAQKNLAETQAALEKISANLQNARAEYETRKAEENLRDELKNKILELNKINSAITELNLKQQEFLKAKETETAAQQNLQSLELTQKKYEERLENLRQQETSLQGADANFEVAKQKLKDAKDFVACKSEIARLQKELSATQKRLEIAKKNFNDAQKLLKQLQLLQKLCAAAKLAETLTDGEPCPVCGSTHHPQLAFTQETIPTDEEIEYAEKLLQKRQVELDAANRGLATVTERINAQQNLLEKFAEVLDVAEAEKLHDAAKKSADDLKIARANLKKGEELTKKITADVQAAKIDAETKIRAAENLRGIFEEKKSQIPEEFLADSKKIADSLNAAQTQKQKLDNAWKIAEDNFRLCEKQHSECAGKVKSAEKSCNDAALKVSGKTPPNIAELQSKKIFAQDSYTSTVAESAALENNLKRLQDISAKLEKLDAEISAADKNFQIWKKLSDAASGEKSKVNFQRYYLNSIFKDVLFEANERLERMSGGRYRFRNEKNALSRKKLEGLDLEIFDAYSGSARPVETLSGGESFLASLSLALGLAAVVKNTAGGIKLDTIFIDEGFGSLDGETLDFAMNALTDLQVGGRLVGIISHVDELKRRVPTRLEVFKTKFGSDAHFVR